MTNLIVTDAQDLEIASPIVELFELTIGSDPTEADTNKLYFHAAKDLDNAQADNDLIFDGNTYVTLPILMDDIEKKTGGTMNRPKLTIANVESLIKTGSSFRTQIDDGTWNSEIDGEAVTAINFKLDDLVGQRLERRRTLEKYTGHDSNNNPVEDALVTVMFESNPHDPDAIGNNYFTDTSGNIRIEINDSVSGNIPVTVTKNNIKPYEGSILIDEDQLSVNIDPESNVKFAFEKVVLASFCCSALFGRLSILSRLAFIINNLQFTKSILTFFSLTNFVIVYTKENILIKPVF